MTQYPSLASSLSFFYSDYANALNLSRAFDAQVQRDATTAVSEHYAALCAIATRQIYGGMEITVGQSTTGTGYSASDIMVFVKEIATSNYVNTVDVINPAWPFFAYTNPAMVDYMILPVMEYAQKNFPNAWAPHDIGQVYPIADGAYQL